MGNKSIGTMAISGIPQKTTHVASPDGKAVFGPLPYLGRRRAYNQTSSPIRKLAGMKVDQPVGVFPSAREALHEFAALKLAGGGERRADPSDAGKRLHFAQIVAASPYRYIDSTVAKNGSRCSCARAMAAIARMLNLSQAGSAYPNLRLVRVLESEVPRRGFVWPGETEGRGIQSASMDRKRPLCS